MDFEYEGIWKGYDNPYYKSCPDCEHGITKDRAKLEKWVGDFMHRSKIEEITTGLAGRPPQAPFGHDASDRWHAVNKIIKAAGFTPSEWGICATCGGEAIDPDVLEEYDAWEPYDPPTGDGYQMWETTTEGSPSSPVFATLDELCIWCEENATTFASFKATKDEWRNMLDHDFVHHKEGSCIFI
jgi:hypothetical protein